MKKLRRFLLFASLFCIACASGDAKEPVKWLKGEKHLIGQRLSTDSEIWSAWSIDVMDSLVVVDEVNKKVQFGVYEIQNDFLKHKESFLRIGRGPLEVAMGYGYSISKGWCWCVLV